MRRRKRALYCDRARLVPADSQADAKHHRDAYRMLMCEVLTAPISTLDPREGWTLKRCIAGMGVGDFIPHWDRRWTPLGYRSAL